MQFPPESWQLLITSVNALHKKELASDPWASHAALKLTALYLAILRGSVCLLLPLQTVVFALLKPFFNAVVVHGDGNVGIYTVTRFRYPLLIIMPNIKSIAAHHFYALINKNPRTKKPNTDHKETNTSKFVHCCR